MGTPKRKSILALPSDYDEIKRISHIEGRTIPEQLHLILESWKAVHSEEDSQKKVEPAHLAPQPTNQSPEALRDAVCDGMLILEKFGLNAGTSGNLSVRTDDGFLITPSGVPTVQYSVTKIMDTVLI